MPIKTELENEAEQARLALEILNDESALHTNILRGNVKMSRATALHIAGATDYDELQAEVERLRKENQQLHESACHFRYCRECGEGEICFEGKEYEKIMELE